MKAGDQLHTFTILEVLGHGGMGGVFVGQNSENDELVAIKTLFEEFSKDEAYVRRFQREASVYRKLNHPNIVRCIASGFDKGIYFIAMEHIKGKPLDVILKENGALGVEHSLKIMDALSGAVYHAHSRGVIHRDVKPQNIMINEQGVVKLLDFGVAQADDDLVKTASGSIVGTFFYSSPEQNQGQKIDERSDLYSLGLVFYEMLVGQRALNGATLIEVSSMQLQGRIKPPSTVDDSVPNYVEKIVMRLLERDPNQRFQSARDLQMEIRKCLDGSPAATNSGSHTAVAAERETSAKWSQAKEAFARRDLDRALELAIDVSRAKTDDAEIHCLLGKIYAAKEYTYNAIEEFKKTMALEPSNCQYKLDFAVALYSMKMIDRAKEEFEKVLEIDKDNPFAKQYLQLIEETDVTGQPAMPPVPQAAPVAPPAPQAENFSSSYGGGEENLFAPPPSAGNEAAAMGSIPPPGGAIPPPSGAIPPPGGAIPPPSGAIPPPGGANPAPIASIPPPGGNVPSISAPPPPGGTIPPPGGSIAPPPTPAASIPPPGGNIPSISAPPPPGGAIPPPGSAFPPPTPAASIPPPGRNIPSISAPPPPGGAIPPPGGSVLPPPGGPSIIPPPRPGGGAIPPPQSFGQPPAPEGSSRLGSYVPPPRPSYQQEQPPPSPDNARDEVLGRTSQPRAFKMQQEYEEAPSGEPRVARRFKSKVRGKKDTNLEDLKPPLDPSRAKLIAFFYWGGGHLYNGQSQKGFTWTIVQLFLLITILWPASGQIFPQEQYWKNPTLDLGVLVKVVEGADNYHVRQYIVRPLNNLAGGPLNLALRKHSSESMDLFLIGIGTLLYVWYTYMIPAQIHRYAVLSNLTGKVVEVRRDLSVKINLGEERGVQVGQIFSIQKRKHVDEVHALNFKTMMMAPKMFSIGEAKVVSTTLHFAICKFRRLPGETSNPSIGDRVALRKSLG